MTELKKVEDQQEWNDYVLENGGHPLQLWGWGELKSKGNWQVERFFLQKDGRTKNAAQVLIRPLPWPFRSLVYVPRGPVVEQVEILDLLSQKYKKTVKPVCITVEPNSVNFDFSKGWRKSKNHVLYSNTIVLDLAKSEEELLGNMAKKTRQYIRKSAGSDLEIVKVKTRQEVEECLKIYQITAKRAGFGIHDDQYYFDLFNLMGDHAPLFAAKHGGRVVAFLWLAISASTAFELYGGIDPEGQELRANYVLKWHAIKKSKEWGIDSYDFNGLLGEGISNFKMGWAEGTTDLVGTYDKPLSTFYAVWTYLLPAGKRLVRSVKKLLKKLRPSSLSHR